MVYVIDWQGRDAHADAVEQMHRLRKTVFVDFFKWNLQHTGGLEFDEYDTPDALYIFDQDPGTGTVISSMRLLPTTGPHLMSEKFTHLCNEASPRGPHVFEISRLLYNPILKDAGDEVMLRARCRFGLGLLEFCRAWDIHELVFVTHAKFLDRLVNYNWDIRPLGLPSQDGNSQISAMRLILTPATLSNLQRQFNYFEPVLQAYPIKHKKAA